MRGRIVLLASDCPSTRIVYHAIFQVFPDVFVILEDRVSGHQLIRRRFRTLGVVTVTGQLLFMLIVLPLLRYRGAARIEIIKRDAGFSHAPIDGDVLRVPSVNSPQARRELARLDPDVVVVNSTRIITKETLMVIRTHIINMHAGITPQYRGVHGGYWALNEGRPDLVGTTVHLVDSGIDTGSVVRQKTFQVSSNDSFVTYPYLHLKAGIPILICSIQDALDGRLTSESNPLNLSSVLRSHPTLWSYITGRLLRGVH